MQIKYVIVLLCLMLLCSCEQYETRPSSQIKVKAITPIENFIYILEHRGIATCRFVPYQEGSGKRIKLMALGLGSSIKAITIPKFELKTGCRGDNKRVDNLYYEIIHPKIITKRGTIGFNQKTILVEVQLLEDSDLGTTIQQRVEALEGSNYSAILHLLTKDFVKYKSITSKDCSKVINDRELQACSSIVESNIDLKKYYQYYHRFIMQLDINADQKNKLVSELDKEFSFE